MKIYVRKLNSQQCTNKSISVTMPIFQSFFENKDEISIIGKKSNKRGNAPFTFTRNREDPRFGGDFKEVLRTEGGGSFKIGDILVVEKKPTNYVISLITEEDPEFLTFDSLLKDSIHTEIVTEESEDEKSIDDIFNHSLYGIHIKKANDALSETNPHICIGWSDLGDLTTITSKDELSDLFDTTWIGINKNSKSQDVGQVWRFKGEMGIGDYVIFSEGSKCHIGKIVSDYYYLDDTGDYQDSDYKNGSIINVGVNKKGTYKK